MGKVKFVILVCFLSALVFTCSKVVDWKREIKAGLEEISLGVVKCVYESQSIPAGQDVFYTFGKCTIQAILDYLGKKLGSRSIGYQQKITEYVNEITISYHNGRSSAYKAISSELSGASQWRLQQLDESERIALLDYLAFVKYHILNDADLLTETH